MFSEPALNIWFRRGANTRGPTAPFGPVTTSHYESYNEKICNHLRSGRFWPRRCTAPGGVCIECPAGRGEHAAEWFGGPYDLEKTGHYWQTQATTQDGKKAYVVVNDVDRAVHRHEHIRSGHPLPGCSAGDGASAGSGLCPIQEVKLTMASGTSRCVPTVRPTSRELLLHPVTLEIVQPTQSTTLTAAHIVDVLQRAGCTRITNVS